MARCACLPGRAVLVALVGAMAAFPAPGQEGGVIPEPAGSTAGEGAMPGMGEAPPAGDAAPPASGAEGVDGDAAAASEPPAGQPSGQPSGQPAAPDAPAGIAAPALVTLDQERFFRGSAFGKAALARAEAAASALVAENRRMEGELEAEEKSLTERRANLPPDEFSALARAFDDKVERIRKEQDEKSRNIGQRLDADRARFSDAAGPVLAEMMGQIGALAILSDSAVILSRGSIDVTDEAIARMDASIGAGDDLAAPKAPAAP